MDQLTVGVTVSYAVFSFFLFYQRLLVKNAQGSSQLFGFGLTLFAFIAVVYGYGFLIYWGWKVSWLGAGALFVLGFLVQILWFPLEAKLGLRDKALILGLLGFIVLPVSGFFMWRALP